MQTQMPVINDIGISDDDELRAVVDLKSCLDK
jgi:hypothetical protein